MPDHGLFRKRWMGKNPFLAWALFATAILVRAEYTDERGVRRVGTPEKKVTTSETEAVPDAYGPHRQRTVNGQPVDFTDAIRWANEAIYSCAEFSNAEQVKRYRQRWGQCFDWTIANAEKWKPWLVGGRVLQVIEGIVRVDCGDTQVLLKNHPRPNTLSEGEGISLVAMPIGKKMGKTSTGSMTIIRLYDYGIPVAPSPPPDRGSLTNQVNGSVTNQVRPK